MSSDIKAVTRFEYTPYGMVEVIDGWYVNISDHEAAISKLRSNHERVVGELAAEVERLRKIEARFEWLFPSRRADWSQKIDTAMGKGNAS